MTDIIEKEIRHAEIEGERVSSFMVNMAHEIRTPMSSIVGFARLMAETEDKEEKNTYLMAIEENHLLMKQLLDDITSIVKMEDGVIQLRSREVPLGKFFDEIFNEVQMRAVNPAVKIVLDKPETDIVIATDRVRLLQIINNLLNNALKFTRDGFIRFGYHMQDALRIYIYESDTGIGIAEDKKEIIFQRYVKLNDEISGSGLGLEITKRLVEALGGEMGVESQEGYGSTFWMALPLKMPDNKTVAGNGQCANMSCIGAGLGEREA